MNSKASLSIALVTANLFGLFLGWMDTRPNWDDTAVTVVAVLALSAIFGFVMKSRPWLWGLSVGVWIPLLNIVSAGNFGSVAALGFALVGAGAGFLLRKAISLTTA